MYRDRIQTLAEGRPWRDPPVAVSKKPPLSKGGGSDDSVMRRNQSESDFRGVGTRGGALAKARSSGDIYSRSEVEASAASKESFFARRMAENECKPEGLPPSRGGKYVGFGSSPGPVTRRGDGGDVFSVVSEVKV